MRASLKAPAPKAPLTTPLTANRRGSAAAQSRLKSQLLALAAGLFLVAQSAAPLLAEVTTGDAGDALNADDPVRRATTLAEEILSAATITGETVSSAGASGIPADDLTADPAQAASAVAPSPALRAAAATATTSGVERAGKIVADLNRETIEVRVSVSQQMMEVWFNGEMIHEWPVSTARKGKVTPRGSFKPQWLSKNHKSSLYNNAPMPYSIFYSGNYAIHGTDQESKLGRPASAGCVRLSRANAKILFAMVQQEGKNRMRVNILD